MDVNVRALMQLTYLLLPRLRRLPKAVIINVASLAAFSPMPSMAVYAATKAFILNFSLDRTAAHCESITPVIESPE